MDIILIGSGNVATHLASAFKSAGHRILQVYSRTLSHAKELADTVQADATNQLTALYPNAAIYLIAVKDDAIGTVASQLPANLEGIVVHTSGSTSIDILRLTHVQRYGVLYPLQTFSKAKVVDSANVPMAIEANDAESISILHSLSASITQKTFICDSTQRLSLHVAAVFACNFTNHLYRIARDILHEQQLDFELIRPLILETAEKVMTNLPEVVQTGPAIRKDLQTIEKHQEFLRENPDLQRLYQMLSARIFS